MQKKNGGSDALAAYSTVIVFRVPTYVLLDLRSSARPYLGLLVLDLRSSARP